MTALPIGQGLGAPSSVSFMGDEWAERCLRMAERRGSTIKADVDATRRRILDMSRGRCTFDVMDANKFGGFSSATARIGRIEFKFLSWNCDTQCETSTFRTRDHHVAIHIPLRGAFDASQADHALRVNPGQALIVSAPGLSRRRWEGPCDLLNIMIEREAIEHFLSRDAADGVPDLLDRRPLTLIDLNSAITFTRFVETMIHDVNNDQPAFQEPAIGLHAEHLLVMLLVKSLNAQTQHVRADEKSTIAPYYVRRAERFMRAHYATSIEPHDLAHASGVSLRTLYYGFKKYRNLTPVQYLKDMRLIQARRILIEAQSEGGRIHHIAAMVGYENRSQFARDYRVHFGETPRETLRGVRRRAS
jgi:AraC-like DNA-binding protein